MKKTDIGTLPEFYDRYINLAPDTELIEALQDNPFQDNIEKMKELQNHAYAPEKWTINQLIRHCIDTERIMAYRALRFARKDFTSLAGFDENFYADHTEKEFDFIYLMNEFEIVRTSTLYLFESFTDEMLLHKGTASDIEISVLSLGFVIVGHPMHHAKIIQERYF